MTIKTLAAATLFCSLASLVPAAAQEYYPAPRAAHHSCFSRVRHYCPDLPHRRGVVQICAARLRLPVQTFCHGHFRAAPPAAVIVPPTGAVVPVQPGYGPGPGYYQR